MSYQLFGRVIKAEYLSLGTLITAGAVAYASIGGKKAEPAPSGATVRETIQKVKESIPLNAGSSEEEQLVNSIKKFIEEEEKKSAHH